VGGWLWTSGIRHRDDCGALYASPVHRTPRSAQMDRAYSARGTVAGGWRCGIGKSGRGAPPGPLDSLTAQSVTRRTSNHPSRAPRKRSREGTAVKRIDVWRAGVDDAGVRHTDWPLMDARNARVPWSRGRVLQWSIEVLWASVGSRRTSATTDTVHCNARPSSHSQRRRQTTLALLIATGFPRMAAAAGPSIAQSGWLHGHQSPGTPYTTLAGLRALEWGVAWASIRHPAGTLTEPGVAAMVRSVCSGLADTKRNTVSSHPHAPVPSGR